MNEGKDFMKGFMIAATLTIIATALVLLLVLLLA